MFGSKRKLWFPRSEQNPVLGSQPPSKKCGLAASIKYIMYQWIHKLIHLNESPYRIAMGCSCGIFCSALPIFGQTFIALILARVLRASVIASLPWTWISNPLTTLPMWYGGYRLGIWITPSQHKPLSYIEIQLIMQDLNQMDWIKGLSLLSNELWETLQSIWLGTVVIGLAMALPSFILIYYFTKELIRRRQQKN